VVRNPEPEEGRLLVPAPAGLVLLLLTVFRILALCDRVILPDDVVTGVTPPAPRAPALLLLLELYRGTDVGVVALLLLLPPPGAAPRMRRTVTVPAGLR
jgi:hypothetical protein